MRLDRRAGPGLWRAIDVLREYVIGNRQRDLAVFCAAALMTLPRAPFSPVQRLTRSAVVSQYSVTFVQHVVFSSGTVGTLPNVHRAKPDARASTRRGRPVNPLRRSQLLWAARSSSRVGRVPLLVVRDQRVEHGAFLVESPPARPAGASAAPTSGGIVAGKLMWMPSNPAGAWRASRRRWGCPSRRPARRSGCIRGASSAPPSPRDVVGVPTGAGSLLEKP